MTATQTALLLALLHVVVSVEIPYYTLSDGRKIQAIAFGSAKTPGDPNTAESFRQATLKGIELGYRLIDTAALYGSEAPVGEAIAEAIKAGMVKREDLFVISKLWADSHPRKKVVPALRESLRKMNLDYFDCYMIHGSYGHDNDGNFDLTDYMETWKGMEDGYDLGLTKSIGLSNFNATQIDRILANGRVKPVIHQFEINLSLTQEPLVQYCKEKDIIIMSFATFGYLVPKKDAPNPPPRFDDPVLLEIGRKYNKTSFQIALRFQVDRGIIPIAKSIYEHELRANLDIFTFKLTEEEIETLKKFNKDIRVYPAFEYKDHPYYSYYPY